MEAFWLAVTQLGRDEVFIVVLTLYSLLVNPRGGRQLGVLFAISYLINTALKYGLDVPRPYLNAPQAIHPTALAGAQGPAMPSGHAQMMATLWWGMAAQVRLPWLWLLSTALVILVAASRVALEVHRPLEVLVGLFLGGLVLLGLRWRLLSKHLLSRLLPPLSLLIAVCLPASVPKEFAAGLGLLAGFWAARPSFQVPRDWLGRSIVAIVGLVVVFAVYFGLSWLLSGLAGLHGVRALRYALLVLVATHGVPMLLQRWLPEVQILDVPSGRRLMRGRAF